MNQKQKPLKEIKCTSTGDALRVLSAAHKLGLPASYHPRGGMTHKISRTPEHSVWVEASTAEMRKLEQERSHDS